MKKHSLRAKSLVYSKHAKRWLGVLSSGLIAIHQGFAVWHDIYPPQPRVSGESTKVEYRQSEE